MDSMQTHSDLKSDADILREAHQFIRAPERGVQTTWEDKLAAHYESKLYKEFAISDLTNYKKGQLGLRWRTKQEVLIGKGETFCGDKHCHLKLGLQTYEVYFKYIEHHVEKAALVKLSLCTDCGAKLKLYREEKRRRDHKRNSSLPFSSKADAKDKHASEMYKSDKRIAHSDHIPTALTDSQHPECSAKRKKHTE